MHEEFIVILDDSNRNQSARAILSVARRLMVIEMTKITSKSAYVFSVETGKSLFNT